MMKICRAEVAMLLVLGAAVVFALSLGSFAVFPRDPCPIPVPPIPLRTVSSSAELAFFVEYSTYRYAEGSPQAPVSHLRFELAGYNASDDYLGPGTVLRAGRLDSLNESGDFQYHDMAAEGEFSPGNDFFILLGPPAVTLQLRILDPTGESIAWNSIIGCI